MTNEIVVISPETLIEGVGQDVWGDRWWQYNLPLPTDKNPANFDDESDPRGRRGSLEKAQEAQYDDVFYLAASFSSGDPFDVPSRTIIVPDGQTIFFPIVNVNWRYGENGELGELEQIGEYPEDIDPLTPEEIRIINTAIIDAARNAVIDLPNDDPDQGPVLVPPYLELNGESVTGNFPDDFRQVSPDDSDDDGKPGFSFVLNGNRFAAVGEGYWVGLEALPSGDHTIQFGGAFDLDEIEIDLDGDNNASLDPSTKEGYVNTLLRSFGELTLDVTYNVLNRIEGDNGKNNLPGTEGNDYIDGRNGKDELLGYEGDDLLVGGNAPDLLDGGTGSDELWGDNGKDTFVYKSGYGTDTIFDFARNEVVEIEGFTELPEITDITLGSGVSATEIDFGQGDTLTFVNVASSDVLVNLEGGKITL